MTEKQTLPPSYPPEKPLQPGELISDDQLRNINEGARGTSEADPSVHAAIRIVETRNYDNETPTQPIPVVEAKTEQTDIKEVPKNTLTKGLLAGATVAFGVATLNSIAGGAELSPEKYETDTTIRSLTLSPGADILHNPFNEEDLTSIAQPDAAAVTIETPDGVHVYEGEGTNNDIWYGVEPHKIPNLPVNNDKDNIVWINEQGIESVERSEG